MWNYTMVRKSGSWWVKGFLFSLLCLCLGCASNPPKKQVLNVPSPKPQANISQSQVSFPEVKPIFKELSPLETIKLSLSVRQEDAITIFHLLAREAGLNLIIKNEVYDYLPREKRFVTAEFHNYSLKEILDSLCQMLDLTYEIKDGIIYIKAFEEQVFDLSFLQTLRGSKFSVGGNVLGGNVLGGGTSTAGVTEEFVSPLKGQYELKGETTKNSTDIYKQLEASIKTLLSPDGTYTLNRMTGNLFVRDHPAYVRRIARLIERIKECYDRQVLIEAKIVEVELSKGHNCGIDWARIRTGSLPNVSAANLNLGSGISTLTLTYQHKPSFEGVLNLLETYGRIHILSNPRIRSLNGQPALISVGRSVGYVSEINREMVSSENIAREETTVNTSAIFDGLLLGVTPRILDNRKVILHIVPIKSDLIDLKREEFGKNTVVTLPQVNLREMSTVIKVSPHDLVIIGGLILDKETREKRGVWGVSHIPILGHIFTHAEKNKEKVELVIMLKVSPI